MVRFDTQRVLEIQPNCGFGWKRLKRSCNPHRLMSQGLHRIHIPDGSMRISASMNIGARNGAEVELYTHQIADSVSNRQRAKWCMLFPRASDRVEFVAGGQRENLSAVGFSYVRWKRKRWKNLSATSRHEDDSLSSLWGAVVCSYRVISISGSE